jgi:hypothetical protein
VVAMKEFLQFLFKHRHHWEMTDKRGADAESALIIVAEKCRCGKVRTIEYEKGKAPVVRMGEVRA